MKNKMREFLIIFALVLSCLDLNSCELNRVKIKSHKLLTPDIAIDAIKNMYDYDMSTSGSFHSSVSKNIKVDFDWGENLVIDKIIVIMKLSDDYAMSFNVGNLIIDEGGLNYNCSKKANSANNYECRPQCSSSDQSRHGIVARRFSMELFLNANIWVSIYELEVYQRQNVSISDSISEFRVVKPDSCPSKSWLLTQPTSQIDSIVHKIGTKIFLEKNYIVTEVDVKFHNDQSNELKLNLINEQKKLTSVRIDISKCSKSKSMFTCRIGKDNFPVRIIEIASDGVFKLFFRGKTVFYPTIEVFSSSNKKENLKLSCEINQCDMSVHHNCSEETLKSGVKFMCQKNRLLRMPSGSDGNSFVIASQGQVEQHWKNTKFAVEANEKDKMIVSFPRTYQYYGQYKCSCILGDDEMTEITSNETQLSANEFLENFVFQIDAAYKLEETDENYINVTDNIIILPEGELKNSYIVAKVFGLSLLNGINLNITVPTAAAYESTTLDTSTEENIKAFPDNPQSWSVIVYKYLLEVYPEFLHQKGIDIKFDSKKYNLSQSSVIKIFKITPESKSELMGNKKKSEITLKAVLIGSTNVKIVMEEKSCKQPKTDVLAVVNDKKCDKVSVGTVCFSQPSSVVVSSKLARNIASTYNFSMIDISSNQVLGSFVSSSEASFGNKDVVIKTRYTDIKIDSSNPKVKIVQLELELVSKMIDDYIPCGKVNMIINQPNKDKYIMTIQSSTQKIDVEVSDRSVIVNITLEIDGINGNSMTSLTVIDPTTFSIGDLSIEGDSQLFVKWRGIDKIASSLLTGYEMKISKTIIPCNDVKNDIKNIDKNDLIDENDNYKRAIGVVSETYSSKYSVSIQPFFTNNIKGEKKEISKEWYKIRKTGIIIDTDVLSSTNFISIVHSQGNIPCKIKNVEFNLTSSDLETVDQDFTDLGFFKYRINKLVPGRNYQLTAKVVYLNGPTDLVSKVYSFKTADVVSTTFSKHVTKEHEKVNISCTAELGPNDKFKKTISWRRFDSSQLPLGVESHPSKYNPQEVFLVMEKALADNTADYGCFVEPGVHSNIAKLTVIINDLVITPSSLKVNFAESSKPININCHSKIVGDIQWTDSNGNIILQKDTNQFTVNTTKTPENAVFSTLTINNPSLDVSGKYTCSKTADGVKTSQTFILYGDEDLKITEMANSSSLIGEKRRLRCSGTRGTKNQKVQWDVARIKENNHVLFKLIDSNSANENTKDIEITNSVLVRHVTCLLEPSISEDKKSLSKEHKIKLTQKIEISGVKNVTAGASVNLTCVGYYDTKSPVIEWVFFRDQPNGGSDNGKVVLSSGSQTRVNSYEPVRLIYTVNDVKVEQAGRYECRFKSDTKSQQPVPKSLSLSVKANILSVIDNQNDPRTSAHTISSRSIYCLLFIAFSILILY